MESLQVAEPGWYPHTLANPVLLNRKLKDKVSPWKMLSVTPFYDPNKAVENESNSGLSNTYC